MNITVNVDQGFLPRFSADFVSHFGIESVFVRAVSDYFTMALARMLAAQGKLNDAKSVKLFATEDAARSLSRLIRGDRELAQSLMESATGSKPAEHFQGVLLATKRPEIPFAAWLSALEKGDFTECDRLCGG